MPIIYFVYLGRFRLDPTWKSMQVWTILLGTISAVGVILLTVSSGITHKNHEKMGKEGRPSNQPTFRCRLVLSPRTVNAHLTSIYSKPGVCQSSFSISDFFPCGG